MLPLGRPVTLYSVQDMFGTELINCIEELVEIQVKKLKNVLSYINLILTISLCLVN